MYNKGDVMSKMDVLKIALDLANVLMDAGEEVETILEMPETEKLLVDVKKLVSDLKGE